MPRIKCYEVVSEVLDEATNRFAPLFEEVQERRDILKQYCGVIDALIEEFNAESYDVEVDEINMSIAISIETVDMVVETTNHNLFRLIDKATSVTFSCGEDGFLKTTFTFPSIWSHM